MKIYISKSKVNCRPCSFINLTGIKGNKKIEETLASTGQLTPFKASNYSTFLVWAERHKVNLNTYTQSKKLNEKMFNLMFFYEKIPKRLQTKYKKMANELLNKRNKKYKDKIRPLKNPINKLNELLAKKQKVAFLIADLSLNKSQPVPHWVVAFKKINDKYYFMDNLRPDGIAVLDKKEISKRLEINKKIGFYPQLVAMD
jgi:hypothetical protein